MVDAMYCAILEVALLVLSMSQLNASVVKKQSVSPANFLKEVSTAANKHVRNY